MVEKVTSAQIKVAIRSHFSAGHKVLFEVSNDTGAKIRTYADAVAVGIWPSTGHEVHGFEIKVSRSDFLAEMKNPAKSLPIYKHCHRWSLVCPAGMVDKDELPATWGLFAYKGEGLRKVKTAPLLQPEPLSPGFMAAIIRRAGEADDQLIATAVERARREISASMEETYKRRLSREIEERNHRRNVAAQRLDELESALGYQIPDYGDIKELAACIRAVRQSGVFSTFGGLSGIARQLEQSAMRIREAIIELEPPEESDD